MRLTGKEDASWCVEKNGKPYFICCELNWYQLLNSVMLDRIEVDLEENEKIEKLVTQYITINDIKLSKGTKISVKFQVSLIKNIIDNNKYIACESELKVCDFYNRIVDLFEFYAYELDTTINNIKIEIIELNIINKEDI